MNWLDFVIIGGVGFVALAGMKMGGIHMAVTAAGCLAGISLASRLHGRLEPAFSPFIDNQNSSELAAFVAIFVIVAAASLVIGLVVRSILGKVMLGWTDRVIGLGLAATITLAIGSGGLSAVQSYPVLGIEETIGDSVLGSFLADNFDTVLRGLKFIPDDLGNDIPGG